MKKVAFIFLPFATKRKPRAINCSKSTVSLILLSMFLIFVCGAYVILDTALTFYQNHQLTKEMQQHEILVAQLNRVQSQIYAVNAELTKKDDLIRDISVKTETVLAVDNDEFELNATTAPTVMEAYLATKQRDLSASDVNSMDKVVIVKKTITQLETHLALHGSWVANCSADMAEKYDKWAHLPTVMPLDGVVTCGFGRRRSPFGGLSIERHNGVDIAGALGLPIKATGDGTVMMARWVSGYGNLVILDHENGLYSYYGHCSLLKVVEGQKISRYDTIALLGSTGRSTGPHLHYELRRYNQPFNPYTIIEADERS